jgi:hypothetical protein
VWTANAAILPREIASMRGMTWSACSKKAVGWHQAVDAHVRSPIVVVVAPRGRRLTRTVPVL